MKKLFVLHIEDNPGDIILTKEALQSSDYIGKIEALTNGQIGIDYLTGVGEYKDRELPDIVLLDINMPKKNGFEVLEVMKKKTYLRHIPVIVFTTSSFNKDIDDCYKRNANCYVIKPMDVNDFFEVIEAIENFWMSTAKLPN